MKQLKELEIKVISAGDQNKITGGVATPSDRTYSTYVTCDNGQNCDTYTVYYLDGSFHQSYYETNSDNTSNSR